MRAMEHTSAISPIVTMRRSDIEAPQLGADYILQTGRLIEMSEKLFNETIDLFIDGFSIVVIHTGGSDVSARG